MTRLGPGLARAGLVERRRLVGPAGRRSLGLVGLVGLVVGGCMPVATSSQGQEIANLYQVFLVAGVVVAVIVWGLVTWSLVRYRRRAADELPVQTPGNLPIELIWTAIPLLTVLILFVLTLRTLSVVDAQSPNAMQLHVTAFRWGWQAVYPADGRTLISTPGQPLEIVLPVGQTVHVTIDSTDVNHAFFVPTFLFKRDAIPGKPSTFDLLITSAGSYSGVCAEFCGVYHDQMPFTIKAVAAADFGRWLASAPGPANGG